ncbi:MAG: NAD-dependent epimerase/dehydratase family protein [Agathobacter sp.]
MFITNMLYREDLETAIQSVPAFHKLKGKSFLLTGATGLIASFLVDLLLYANDVYDMQTRIYALGRTQEGLSKRFSSCIGRADLSFVEQDVREKITLDFPVDYVIHAAGNGYPAAFREDPVGTMTTAFIGTNNILEYVRAHHVQKVIYISSGEVYGRMDVERPFRESDSGYVDCASVRACYPSAKRAAESLVISYVRQYGIDASIVRPGHTYGPNTSAGDNRANTQFMKAAVAEKEIILHSAGGQIRSYTYIADNISALLTVLIHGQSGEAYNIANRNSRGTISDFATLAAECAGVKYSFEEPDQTEKEELTPIKYAVLDAGKLEGLGWRGTYSLPVGIKRTYQILKEQS